MSEPVIRAIDLTIGWGETILQRAASFEIEQGDIFVILGGSGCGKSTMMRYLIGLEKPMSGQVLYASGREAGLKRGPPQFGVMFQSGALLGSLTVGENIALALQAWTDLSAEAIWAIVQARLRLVGLQGAEGKLPSELSGGMKKRAAIARAMALEPQLLFLDEPSAGLDPVSAAQLDELILTLNAQLGITVVAVTHDLESIFKIGQRCLMLDRASKSIIAFGDPRALRDDDSDRRVHAFFNRQAEATV
jgi:phospholipid/cholesterol/gamma-HCH transport system ATP-binding protein